ncbi:MAG: PAS domain S-box protein [Novosphingobium sp.]
MDPANLFAAIVNSTDAAVISKALDGTILSWNPAAEDIFGRTAAEMIGQSIRTIIPPDHQHEEDRIANAVINGQSSVRLAW